MMAKRSAGLLALAMLFLIFIAHADSYTIKITPSKNVTLSPGETVQASVSVEPVNLMDHKVYWSSENEYIASVSASGVITARAAGQTKITAMIETGDKSSITVNVKGNQVTSIVIIDADIELEKGCSAQMSCRINDSADDKRVIWSSDDKTIATIDKNGVVTAVGYGTALITACAANGKTATASVYVPAPVTSVMLDPSEFMLSPGDSIDLDAYVFPGNAKQRTVTWTSSDPGIATVNQDGVVKGIKEGKCTIRAATPNGTYATASATIIKVPKTLSLSASEIYFTREYRKAELKPVITPASCADCELIWESSDESVVSVTGGKLSATGYGEAVVTVRSVNGLSASCSVIVSEKATGIAFSEEAYSAFKGSLPFHAEIVFMPEGAKEKIVSLKSENELVCTIDENGYVTPKNVGATNIIAITSSGLKAKAHIQIVEETRSLSFPCDSYTLAAFTSKTISVSAQSQQAVLPEIVWRSSVPEVCAVVDGVLYARREGSTVITASSYDGSLSCLCEVTVLPNPSVREKVIALTFDNGPGENTIAILEALDAFGAPATFFLLGRNVERYPEIACLLKETPHEIGNHTYENMSLNTSTIAEISTSLQQTDAAISKAVGREATVLRAPDANLSFQLFSTFLDSRPFIGWSESLKDLQKDATAESIKASALTAARDGAILVFHDQSPVTHEALKDILGALVLNGYRFVTVSELRDLTGDTAAVFTPKK